MAYFNGVCGDSSAFNSDQQTREENLEQHGGEKRRAGLRVRERERRGGPRLLHSCGKTDHTKGWGSDRQRVCLGRRGVVRKSLRDKATLWKSPIFVVTQGIGGGAVVCKT